MATKTQVQVLLAGEDGASGRNFAPFFCRYGLAAMGPAPHGPFTAAPERYAGPVQRFCELPAGTLLALRLGAVVTAVGEVVEAPYQYVPGLGYADGWDLRHVRRVAWKRIEAYTLPDPGKAALSAVGGDVASALRAAWEKGRPASSGTEFLPDLSGIGDQGVLSNFAARGAPFDRLNAVAAGLVRARRLAAWQQATTVSVAEVQALLVIPFLESLGWSPFSLRLDWRRKRRGKSDGQRLELAIVDRPDRPGSAPRAAIVVMRPGTGLSRMVRHAEKAVGSASGARLLVVTDGRMWQVRIRGEQHWEPWATLDLVWPTARFHFDAVAADIPGATEAIEALSPWASLPPRPTKEKAPELPPEVIAHLEGSDGLASTGSRKRKRRRRRGRRSGEGEAQVSSTAAPKAVQPAEDAPKPAVEAPNATAEAPKPAVEAPKPAVEAPKPAVEAPKPAVEAPKPAVEAPKPAVEAPAQGTEAPKPAKQAPKPTVDAPKPEQEPPPAAAPADPTSAE